MVLLVTLVRIAKLTVNNTRVPAPEDRARLLRAIDRSEGVLSRRLALRIIGLRSSRHGQWKRESEQGCPVDDLSQCPRMHPGQLTPDEVGQMGHMVTAPEYRHVPTSTLAILAQRLGGEKFSPRRASGADTCVAVAGVAPNVGFTLDQRLLESAPPPPMV